MAALAALGRRVPSDGLLARIVTIILLTLLIEFVASTLLYERASVLSVRTDEARRIAEHLVVSRRLLSERPVEERGEIADELTTDRYTVHWSQERPRLSPIAPRLRGMRERIETWEPSLAEGRLRLRLTAVGRSPVVTGELRLKDGSWLLFHAREPVHTLELALGRAVLTLIAAGGLLIVSSLFVRRTLQPLVELADVADRVGCGSPMTVIERGPGEVRRVTGAFNRMQARITRLIDERTRALAAVGHDMRTPLARLRLRVDTLAETETRDALGADLVEMEAMVSSLLAFLGGEEDAEKAVLTDLAVLCANLVDDAQDRGFDAVYAGPDHFDRRLRAFGFKRALVNLVDNALHYGGNVTISLTRRDGDAVIRVTDDGPGIPEESLDTVREPFVRLDSARRRDTVGFGLGLSIVDRAVAAEGGIFTLSNRPSGGLSAEIVVPAH